MGKITITLPFGVPHPVTGTHQGVDFVLGDHLVKFPYYRGRCIYVGHEPTGAGLYVVFRCIDQDNHTHYVEADHFETLFIKQDQVIFKNAKVGIQGASGDATGVHTHWMRCEPVDCQKDLTDYYGS